MLSKYCETNEFNVVKTFKIAETASKQQSRKTFQELLNFIASNNIYHLTVEKTDRLTRNLRDAVAIDDWLHGNSERRLHAVKENIRLHMNSKSDVKFMWNIHLAVAKKYTDNLREEAMKGWDEKLAQGWLPAHPPIGYKTITENGKRIHVPDPKAARSMQKAFKLYLEPNQSIDTIHAKMQEMGLVTRKGRCFSKSAVHRILKNPFYIGINRFNGKDYPGAQEPIIPEKIFNAVQEKMSRGRPIKYTKHNPVLKNIMHCSICGKAITWQKQKGRLYGSCQRDLDACKQRKFIKEEEVRKRIENMLVSLICPSERVIEWLIDLLRSDFQDTVDNRQQEIQAIETKIRRLETMDDMLYDDKLAGLINQERYAKKHEELQTQLAETKKQLGGISKEYEERYMEGVTIIELSQHASAFYRGEDKDNDEKRAILTKLFASMVVEVDSVSVKFTKLAQAIAAKSLESRRIMQALNKVNQTAQNMPNNRGEIQKTQLDAALCPVWQGRRDSNPRPSVLETDALTN